MYYVSIELLVVSMLTASCSPRPENQERKAQSGVYFELGIAV